jgi:hypothetical protein
MMLLKAMVEMPNPRLSCGRRSSIVAMAMVPSVEETSIQQPALASA